MKLRTPTVKILLALGRHLVKFASMQQGIQHHWDMYHD
jgi:hypothetical protein